MFNKTASANSNRIVVTEISLDIGFFFTGDDSAGRKFDLSPLSGADV